MSMAKKAWLTLTAKADRALDWMTDPRETIRTTSTATEVQLRASDICSAFAAVDSCQRQRDMLTELSSAITAVAASRECLDQLVTALRQQQAKLEVQARHALDTRAYDQLAAKVERA